MHQNLREHVHDSALCGNPQSPEEVVVVLRLGLCEPPETVEGREPRQEGRKAPSRRGVRQLPFAVLLGLFR